jgi:predicted metal-dependent peptidase
VDKQAETKLIRARIALITEQPFWGTLALRLRLVEDNSIPTLAVDGKTVWYNAKFINNLSDSLCKSAVAHEVGHCIYEHIARRGARQPSKWNKAGDYVINAMLKDSNFEIGDGWLFNPAYAGFSSDHIYNLLPDDPPGKGSGAGDPGGELCEIRSGETNDDEQTVDEWKLATVQAATIAKQQGKLPASLERFIGNLVNPKTDWKTVLRRFVTEVSKNDYSWSRPKKMMIPHGFYLPTLYSETMGLLVAVIDVSGSIDQHTLNVFGSEIQAVRDSVHPEKTIIIYCDAKVQHVDEFLPEDVAEFKMHGGGGTDFRPPFDWLEQRGERPAAFLYLTDMYGCFPESAPDYPVLWCKTTDVDPPWGESVEIEV